MFTRPPSRPSSGSGPTPSERTRRRPGSAATHDSVGNESPPTSTEQLEKEYKNTEAMRRAYTKENESIIKRQNETLGRLKAENKELNAELKLENKLSKKFSTKNQKSKLVEQLHDYEDRIKEEESKAEETKESISNIEKEIKELEKQTGGAHGAVNNYRTLNKRIRILENRLNKALVKFNTTLSKNNSLRKEIDDLRQERIIFERTYQKLEDQLNDKKKRMAEAIERSNEAYEIRDQAILQLQSCTEADQRDEERKKKYIEEKEREVSNKDSAKELSRQMAGDVQNVLDEDRQWEERLQESENKISDIKQTISELSKTSKEYEEAFRKIKDACSVDDIASVIEQFQEAESENYNLFRYVAEQNAEIENLESQLEELRNSTVEQRAEGRFIAEKERENLKPLEERKKMLQRAANSCEVQYSEMKERVDEICSLIGQVSQKLGAPSGEPDSMSNEPSVSELNALQHLRTIEHKGHRLSKKYLDEDSKHDSPSKFYYTRRPQSEYTSRGTIAAKKGILSNLEIQTPDLREFDNTDANDSRPLSMQEVQKMTKKRLQSRSKSRQGTARPASAL
eukprot:gb/GECG01005663.1/.p1 GENE.gb/GECG01005663.1/~~gb/GECG01005663.1/.p1  ORF type:complete len:569 (+),score=124.35 gb/GECG01005663.1/:1-1707(+)